MTIWKVLGWIGQIAHQEQSAGRVRKFLVKSLEEMNEHNAGTEKSFHYLVETLKAWQDETERRDKEHRYWSDLLWEERKKLSVAEDYYEHFKGKA